MKGSTPIQHILQSPYNRSVFVEQVLTPVFGACFHLSENPSFQNIETNERRIIGSTLSLGQISPDDGSKVNCYEIALHPSAGPEQCHTAITAHIRSLTLKDQYALISIVSPRNKDSWRLTLVVNEATVTDRPVRQYSFLMGPSENCVVAAERFALLGRKKQKRISSVLKTFSADTLKNAFITEYTLHYRAICHQVSKAQKNKPITAVHQYVKKLLAREMFFHFARKKNLPRTGKRLHGSDEKILQLNNANAGRSFSGFMDAFNFTVRENSLNDYSIAITPEMLGHIFETLLEDNKNKGTFYTPPEIVHYMCRKCLAEYLVMHDAGKKEQIAGLLNDSDCSTLTKPQLKKIDRLLSAMKVYEPAVGSGAFALGMIKEIHGIKELIASALHLPWNPRRLKESIIQNNIYGVDIEGDAIAIVQQRLCLSLVAETDNPRSLPQPLHNITFGDSLICKPGSNVHSSNEETGFDIIIGNPPYLNFKMYSAEEKEAYKQLYPEIFDGKADVYYYFFIKATQLAKPKSIISLITPRYWLEAAYARKLRKFLSSNTTLLEIVDFKNATIFDGIGIKTAITTFLTNQSEQQPFHYRFHAGKNVGSVRLDEYISTFIPAKNIIGKESWNLTNSDATGILSQIEDNAFELQQIAHCKQGVVTGLDKAFVAGSKELEKLPAHIIKPWLKVGDIYRYSIRPVEKRKLAYTQAIQSIDEHPEFYNRLLPYKSKLSNRREAKNGRIRWFDLQWPRDPGLFESEKLICRFKASENTFCYDNSGFYSSADTTVVVLKKGQEKEISTKYLLALLNSKLLTFYFRSYGKLMDYRYEYYPGPVGKLRIRRCDFENAVVNIVHYLLHLHNTSTDSADLRDITAFFEKLMDACVYEIYFPEKMLSEKASVSEYINHLPVLQGGSGVKKQNLKIIERAYKNLSSLAHPLQQALLKLYEIREVEIIEGRI